MDKHDLINAINNLRPGSEFTFENADYSTINWIILEGNAPTKKQIDDEFKRIKANEITEAETKAKARQAIADRLGLTADELQVLLG
jgi:hypothetical protein